MRAMQASDLADAVNTVQEAMPAHTKLEICFDYCFDSDSFTYEASIGRGTVLNFGAGKTLAQAILSLASNIKEHK